MWGHFSGAYLTYSAVYSVAYFTYSVVYSVTYLTYHTAVDMGGGGDKLFTWILLSYPNFYNNSHCLYIQNPIHSQPNDALPPKYKWVLKKT